MIEETKWSIDQSHSRIAFKIKHLMISYVTGRFERFNADIYTTTKDFTTAEIDLWIDAASINTGDEKRDQHLRSKDFLDVPNHDQIIFRANQIGKPDKNGNRRLRGDLTIKNIIKNVELNVQFGGIAKDPWGNEKAGFTVSGKINRNDWGLNWNSNIETGGFILGEEIIISCDIELIKEVNKEQAMEMEASVNKKDISTDRIKK